MNLNPACVVCTKATSKYKCPRCRIPYCSVACYTSHGKECTEAFYQGHVKDELTLRSGGTSLTGPEIAREKKKMLSILKRTAANEDLEEQRLDADLDRLEILAEKDEVDVQLEDLTPQQRRDFLRAVADGSLGREVIQVWNPWWNACKETEPRRHNHTQRPMVSNSAAAASSGDGFSAKKEVFNVVALSAVQKAPPSLLYNILDVLLSYVAVERLYNGAMTDMAALIIHAKTYLSSTSGNIAMENDVALELLHHSVVLSDDARYDDAQQVVSLFVQKWCSTMSTNPASSSIPVRDLLCVLASKCCVQECLMTVRTSLFTILETDRAVRRHEKERRNASATSTSTNNKAISLSISVNDRRNIKRALKKVDFMSTWCASFLYGDVLQRARRRVQEELTRLEDALKARQKTSHKKTLLSTLTVGQEKEVVPKGILVEEVDVNMA